MGDSKFVGDVPAVAAAGVPVDVHLGRDALSVDNTLRVGRIRYPYSGDHPDGNWPIWPMVIVHLNNVGLL